MLATCFQMDSGLQIPYKLFQLLVMSLLFLKKFLKPNELLQIPGIY